MKTHLKSNDTLEKKKIDNSKCPKRDKAVRLLVYPMLLYMSNHPCHTHQFMREVFRTVLQISKQ